MSRSIAVAIFASFMAISIGALALDLACPTTVWTHLSLTCILTLIAVGYCLFAALHAVQHVADPNDRGTWLLLILFFTVFGALFYLLTKYQAFRAIGKGSLIVASKNDELLGFVSYRRKTENRFFGHSKKEGTI